MEVEIREATIEDLKDIQTLNLRLFERECERFDNTLDTEWTFGEKGTKYFKKKITGKDDLALVATIDNKIIGYLVAAKYRAYNFRTVKYLAEIENMLVLNEYRGMKIGAKLVEEFIKWAKEKKVDRITVTASAGNVKAINFYRKVGFEDYDITLEGDI